MTTAPGWLHKVLLDESTHKYHIEHHVFRSNHMAHGIVALWRLGADESRVRHFANTCSKSLEKPVAETVDVSDVAHVLGKKSHYTKLMSHYTKALEDHGGDVDSLIHTEFSRLSAGLAGAALHGVIQLGYGYNVGCSPIVLEGLAYLHFAYTPLVLSPPKVPLGNFGKGNRNILDVLADVRADVELRDFTETEGARRVTAKTDTYFMPRVDALVEDKGDYLLDYVNSVRVPPLTGLTPVEQMSTLCDWAIDQTICVFALSDHRNDFFLLHGVTAGWSLRQFLPMLAGRGDEGQTAAMEAIRVFLCAVFAVYVAEECPPLQEANIEFPVKPWAEVISDTLSRDCDEHIYKLVQVCHDRSLENADSKMAHFYVKAAQIALDYPLSTPKS